MSDGAGRGVRGGTEGAGRGLVAGGGDLLGEERRLGVGVGVRRLGGGEAGRGVPVRVRCLGVSLEGVDPTLHTALAPEIKENILAIVCFYSRKINFI